MCYLATYNSVQHFNMMNGEEVFGSNLVKKLKRAYLQEVDKYMFENGVQAYGNKAKDIMNYLIHITCVTGVQAVARDTIAKWTGAHKATISKIIKRLVADGLFTVGYLNDTHKGHYVVLFRLHKNYKQAMLKLFGINVDELDTDYQQESTDSTTESQEATSSATSEATSSEAETPCPARAEASKNVSTISTSFTVFEEENKEDIYISSLSLEQEAWVHNIKNSDKILQAYKDVAEEIVATLPAELDDEEFEAFRNLFRNQLTTVVPKYDAVALFKKMFRTEYLKVKHTKQLQAKVQEAITEGRFTFYNWLHGSKPAPSVPAVKPSYSCSPREFDHEFYKKLGYSTMEEFFEAQDEDPSLPW